MTYRFLNQSQVDQFVETGYIIIRNAFPKDVASQWVDRGFQRLGYDRHDRSTWKDVRIHMATANTEEVKTFAPNAWAAICDLLGGEERVQQPYKFGDGFIMNLGVGAEKPWQAPSPTCEGWHKDGDFFRHFLDSPEQGLLTIVCWTDMVHTGGGTFIAPDSVGAVARFLAEHPEGVSPNSFGKLIHQCKQFEELTGGPGDVVLHHPYMLHATSQNVLRVERAITNPPVGLKEPMNFNRERREDFSPLELGVLHGLGVERLDFKPTAPRERIVPERVKKQQAMLEAEKARVAASPT